MTTPQVFPVRRIDCHHHAIPPISSLTQESLISLKGDWKTPEGNVPWFPEVSLKAMDALGIEMAILSYPPGVPFNSGSVAVREANEYLKKIHDAHPDRFGFFACLGDLRDVECALGEMQYALDVLKANGVAITTSYGTDAKMVYLGDDAFDPLWEELNRRKAAVFVHGSTAPGGKPNPHEFLTVHVVEVPNETFKAASHLVVTGKKRKFPDINFILSHFGGSAPFLASRVAVLSRHLGSALTPEEILADFKTFYYDSALSTYDHNLIAMKSFVGAERIVYGTDFPAVSTDMVAWFTGHADGFYTPDEQRMVMRTNLLGLLCNTE